VVVVAGASVVVPTGEGDIQAALRVR